MADAGAEIVGTPKGLAPLAARVAEVARRQYGVISRTQLLSLGMASATVAEWLRAGHLHLVRRGVYAVGHPNISREGRWMAAVLAAGDGAVLSHVPAARFTGLDRAGGAGPIHVTVPRGRHPHPAGVRIHRPRQLARQDWMRRGQVPVTTQTRTLFDLATLLKPHDLRELFEQAEYLESLDYGRLRRLISENPNHRGNSNLRKLLDMPYVPLSRTRSKLERIILRVCRDHRLPVPGVNVPFLDYELDFHWPDANFVVEADGGHHVGERRDKDNARDLAVARAGELTRRYGEMALSDESSVAAELAEILIERLPPSRRG